MKFAGVALALVNFHALAATLPVGPGNQYEKPCAAIAAAAPGDVIEIDASGEYAGDVCGWTTSSLTLRGVGGRPRIDAAGRNAEAKGIWVIHGDNTVVENIEFSGAHVPDRNGAGIRLHGRGLTVRNCYFHDSEMGILGGPAGHVLVEYSEFARHGAGDGLSHNIYIANADLFTFRFNYSHDSNVGHLVKSRAVENHILYNYLSSESSSTSYELNLPNAGRSYVIGNVIVQGEGTQNSSVISYGEEGYDLAARTTELFVVNNTFLNQRPRGTFVAVASGIATPAVIRNNLFAGPGDIASQPAAVVEGNQRLDPSDLASGYRLVSGAPGVDQGIDPGSLLAPRFHYVHPACGEGRASFGALDAGAFEFGGRMAIDGDAPERCRSAPDEIHVVNGAAFTTGPVAPGSIISIFGDNLASAQEQARATPLPLSLGGATVVMDGAPLPLFYASPRQINAQAPAEFTPGQARLTVLLAGREGPSGTVSIADPAPYIFIRSGSNQAVAVNHPEWRLNSVDNPAPVSSAVVVYLTGAGAAITYSATLGGVDAPVLYLGPAPGLVGVAQANIIIPALPPGQHALRLTVAGIATNPAILSTSP